ncbi:OmpA family protein [Brachybacterium sp. Z12]|uniref:OmpA family protein n=1 Tax=Brachybacterium sp. Z12 TaxID=2759167 RepID=UPI001861EF27|nr:OmpA family protein [Brachybacterium sp. Z12]QNN82387.1 OmpA family protein [Brachybacterium sp. Z12]
MTALRRRTLLAVLLAGGTMTACTEQDDSATDGTGGASDGGGEAADPGAVVAESSFFLRHTEVAVRLHPIVRSGEHLVLTVDLTAEGDAAEFEDQYVVGGTLTGEATSAWSDGWGSASGGDTRDFLGVRLVDLAGDQVASTAVDAEGETVGVRADNGETADSGTQALAGTVQIAFADPGTDALAVYLPKLPLVIDVPVIEADVPAVEGAEEQLDLSAIEEAPLEPMLLMSQDLAEPLRETRELGATTVAISSDVLFDSSSADLDRKAKSALDEAAQRIESHEPGPVTVIGHTDSVDSDASNLTLSKERAAAVATALEKRLDTSDYELSTDGKGEAEPIASNDTEGGKALNRRVEIVLETPAARRRVTREMPEFEGRAGTAAEGVRFDGSEQWVLRPFDLQLGAARMLEDHLVVTLEVTPRDEDRSGVTGIGQFDDGIGMPTEPDGVSTYTLLASSGAVGVLVGSVLTYPAFHRAGGPSETTRPLTDLSLNTAADGGVPRILELVFPRDIAGVEAGAEVALQYGTTGPLAFANESNWRMTEVPIGA